MEYIKEITVDLVGDMLFEYITAVQGDTARAVIITVLSNSQPYTPPEGARAVIRCRKPDGKPVFDDATINEDGTITAPLTVQMLATAGHCRCEVALYSADEKVLTTVPFIVKVTPKTVSDNEVVSTAEYTAIEKALAEVTRSEGVANAALEKSTQALSGLAEVEADIDAHTTAAAAATERANTAAERIESLDAYTKTEADTRYSNALTGTAAGAMAHMTDVSGIGSLRRLAVQGETIETGTGDKGPDNPYAVDGVVPAAVSAAGKNLIGLESPYQIASSVEGIGSATVERYNNGVTLTMPAASSATWAAERLWWPITAGTYTLQVKMETNDSNFTPTFGVYLKKALTDTAAALTTLTASGSKTITVGASGYIGLYLHLTTDTGNTGVRTVRYYDIQLEPGNTVTDYEPYTGTTVTLPTLEPLCGDGTINDEYDAATGIETRRWKRVELDGTENWQLDGTIDSSKYRMTLVLPDILNPPDSQTVGDVSCTHYPKLTAGQTYRLNQGISIAAVTAGKRLMIYDSTYNTNDVSGWKSYLAAQKTAGTPVTVVYRLATPEVTQHDPERIVPPAPVCNAYADQGDVDVIYNRDINMAFAALETAMKTLLGGA